MVNVPRRKKSVVQKIWRVAQPLLLVVILVFVARAFSARWDAVQDAATTIEIRWGWIALSCVTVLSTYAVLIESWRFLITNSGAKLGYTKAAQIWFASNLGRYLPGRVWSIGAMGLLSKREGITPWLAGGAAIIGTLLNIGAGFGVTAISAAGSGNALAPYGLETGAIVGTAIFLIGLIALPWILPATVTILSRLKGTSSEGTSADRGDRNITIPSAKAIWIAAVVNICSWFLYGLGFYFLAKGAVPDATGSPLLFTAVFTASYVAGYLALIAPGGIGVREIVLQTLLVSFGIADVGNAILLSLVSRLWLTTLEIAPGLIAMIMLSLAERRSSHVSP